MCVSAWGSEEVLGVRMFNTLFLETASCVCVCARARARACLRVRPITLVNTQNVSAARIIDSSSIQHAETKYGLRIQFLA